MPRGAEKQYGEALDGFGAGIADTAQRGIPPEKVATVIRRALTRRFPDTRYRVGLDARISFVTSRLLGDRLFDRMVARVMKQPKKAST